MGISEKVPLLGIEEFLTEVNDIKELIAAYDENLEEINNIQLMFQMLDKGHLSELIESVES